MLSQEEKEEVAKYNEWYFKCPAGRDGIPFVNEVFAFARMPVTHPDNYTKEELRQVVENAYKRYEENPPQYCCARDFVQGDLVKAMIGRNPKMYRWVSWFFSKESYGHSNKWYDEKMYRMAEAICIYGMNDYQSIHDYMYEK